MKLIDLHNKRTTVLLIIGLIKGAVSKLSMILLLNPIYMVGHQE